MYLFSIYTILLLPELVSSFILPHILNKKSFGLNIPNFKFPSPQLSNNIVDTTIVESETINETQNVFYNFGLYPRLEGPNSEGELTWYPIGFPIEFNNRQPKKVTIRDINYIIWKDSNGYYGLRDACSHQGASFQGGCINANTVTCPYHGYTFSGTNGHLLDIPDFDINKHSSQNINSFKVVEKGGIVFLNTVPNISEETNLKINPNLIWVEPEYNSDTNVPVFLSENFEHNAKFVTVNSLDICHIGFVHTFGNKDKPNPLLNSRVTKINDSSFHYKISYDYLAGSKSIVNKIYNFNKITVENEYILPHTTVARVLFGDYTSTIITIAQPISKFKTRLFVKAYRSYWYHNVKSAPLFLQPFYYLINMFGDKITHNTMYATLKQDKFIVDNIDKTNYETMNGKFSIKYDMMSSHYKNNYKKHLSEGL
jgi:phenylpropionate dioxygenase-like ring-hydroxylating dioxygenase large terminal subunit